MRKMKSWEFLKDVYARFMNDDLLSIGAQASFYLLFSLFPFLIFLIVLLTYMPMVNFQDSIQALAALMPANAYLILRDMVNQTIANRSVTLLSFGMLSALWSSASGVTTLIQGINRAYDQEETRRSWKVSAVPCISHSNSPSRSYSPWSLSFLVKFWERSCFAFLVSRMHPCRFGT